MGACCFYRAFGGQSIVAFGLTFPAPPFLTNQLTPSISPSLIPLLLQGAAHSGGGDVYERLEGQDGVGHGEQTPKQRHPRAAFSRQAAAAYADGGAERALFSIDQAIRSALPWSRFSSCPPWLYYFSYYFFVFLFSVVLLIFSSSSRRCCHRCSCCSSSSYLHALLHRGYAQGLDGFALLPFPGGGVFHAAATYLGDTATTSPQALFR